MTKPRITIAQIEEIRSEIVSQTSVFNRFWIVYGAPMCAVTIGFIQYLGLAPVTANLALLVVLGLAHFWSHDQFGRVPALLKLKEFDLTPSWKIRQIEKETASGWYGVKITKSDWPHIFEAGMRVSALKSIQTFESNVLLIVGYAFAVLMIVFH